MNKNNEPQLYLASASPRRRELLTQLGYRFEVLKLDVPEQREEGEKAQDYVCRLARDKATAGVAAAPTALPVLGADTIVVLGDRVLKKPSDLLDAKDMLEALSGKVHQVMTAVALASKDRCDVRLVSTNVAFRKLDEAEIEAYWQTGEPCDKAGAYGIQESGERIIAGIRGNFDNVMGLPVGKVIAALG